MMPRLLSHRNSPISTMGKRGGRGRDGKEAGNYFPFGCLTVKERKRR
jgi:hypothetical protein